MDFLGLAERSPWLSASVFVICSVVVWLAGTRVSGWAEVIADETKLGDAVTGTVLLGAVASLPEMAMAIGASLIGNAELAVNTLLGGIMFATLIIAVADATDRKRALTSDAQRAVVPLAGSLCVMMLIVTSCGISVGDVRLLGAGAWTWALVGLYVVSVLAIEHTQSNTEWSVAGDARAASPTSKEAASKRSAAKRSGAKSGSGTAVSLRRAVVLTVLASLAILVAGFLAAQTADVLSQQTGLGASFVGLVLGGFATTLPEVSSTRSAVRLQRYDMAFSDAFGTNMLSVALLFACDLAYPGKPILNEVGDFALVSTLLGAAVTSVYVAGLIGRPKKMLLRMGVDSVLVLVMGIGGIVLLYGLSK